MELNQDDFIKQLGKEIADLNSTFLEQNEEKLEELKRNAFFVSIEDNKYIKDNFKNIHPKLISIGELFLDDESAFLQYLENLESLDHNDFHLNEIYSFEEKVSSSISDYLRNFSTKELDDLLNSNLTIGLNIDDFSNVFNKEDMTIENKIEYISDELSKNHLLFFDEEQITELTNFYCFDYEKNIIKINADSWERYTNGILNIISEEQGVKFKKVDFQIGNYEPTMRNHEDLYSNSIGYQQQFPSWNKNFVLDVDIDFNGGTNFEESINIEIPNDPCFQNMGTSTQLKFNPKVVDSFGFKLQKQLIKEIQERKELNKQVESELER